MDHDYSNHIMPRKVAPSERAHSGGWIVPAIILGVIAWLLMALAVVAQTSESTSVSGAAANVEVLTGAAAGINNYGQKPGADNRTYQEVATAPSLGGLALGGGHPCAYSPSTAQVSIIGGGAGFGSSKVDSACMLMVMGAAGDAKAYKASQLMLAARDPEACAAMEAAGMLECTTKAEARAAKRDFSKPAASSKGAVAAGWGAKCELTGKKLAFRPTSAAARNVELSACKARYGL
jgi:hypothetical protein